jgi:hypothetical protein
MMHSASIDGSSVRCGVPHRCARVSWQLVERLLRRPVLAESQRRAVILVSCKLRHRAGWHESCERGEHSLRA